MLVLKDWLESYKQDRSQTCETLHANLWSWMQGQTKTRRLQYHPYHFGIQRQPIVRLWVKAIVLWSQYPRRKPKNRWHSVDADFRKVVAISAPAFVSIKAANTIIMGVCHCTDLELSMMQDQKSLTLRWRSCLRGDCDIIAGLCVHNGGQYCDYSLMRLCGPGIIQDAMTEIGDTPLRFIFRMG